MIMIIVIRIVIVNSNDNDSSSNSSSSSSNNNRGRRDSAAIRASLDVAAVRFRGRRCVEGTNYCIHSLIIVLHYIAI